MRKILAIWFLFQMGHLHAQEENTELQAPATNFETKFILGFGGFNIPFHLPSEELPYGLHFAQRANTVGFSFHLGLAAEIKNRFGLEFTLGYNGFTFRRKYFNENIAAYFPGFDYQGDEKQDVTHSGGYGMDFFYLHPKLYYIINPEANNKLVPLLGVQFSSVNMTTFSYALRTPSTNYFSKFELEQSRSKLYPFYSAGIEIRRTFAVSSDNGRISNGHAALRFSLIYGQFAADYTLTETDYLSNITESEFQANHQSLYLNICLSLNAFSW